MKIELNYNIDDKANPKLTLTYPDGESDEYTDDYFDDKHATSFIYIDSLMQVNNISNGLTNFFTFYIIIRAAYILQCLALIYSKEITIM